MGTYFPFTGRAATLTTPTAIGSLSAPGEATQWPTRDGAVAPLHGDQVLGVNLEHREVERYVEADQLGVEFRAVVKFAGDLAFEFAVLGEDPAVGADDGAERRFFAGDVDAHGALGRLGDNVAEHLEELRVLALLGLDRRQRDEGEGQEGKEISVHGVFLVVVWMK